MAYNFKKDEESKHRRQEIMKIIKQLTESEWNNYVLSPNKKLNYRSYIEEKFKISSTTLASVIECRAVRMEPHIIKKCYRIYAMSDKADKEYFASIFEDPAGVMKMLQGLSANPERTSDVEDENTNESPEMTSDDKVESSEASLNMVDEKMKKYVENSMSDSFNVELELDENTYKKYNLKWKYGDPDISWTEIKYLYIVPVQGSNVKEIVEKKNRMEEDSLIWFIYPVKDEELQKDTEMCIKKCKFPEDCVLMESTLGEKNVYILYNPQDCNVKSYMHSGIYLKEMPIIQVKVKKDGKRKKKKSRKISLF